MNLAPQPPFPGEVIMLSRIEFTTVEDVSSKRMAYDLLISRLASSKITKDNAQLISKLLGLTNGEMHCHLSARSLPAQARKSYCCAIGTRADGRVVVASCFRHAERPRRASAQECRPTRSHREQVCSHLILDGKPTSSSCQVQPCTAARNKKINKL